jgi:hypothetical protein
MKEKFSETPKSPIPTRFEIMTLECQKRRRRRRNCIAHCREAQNYLINREEEDANKKKNFEIVRLKCNKEEEEIVDG